MQRKSALVFAMMIQSVYHHLGIRKNLRCFFRLCRHQFSLSLLIMMIVSVSSVLLPSCLLEQKKWSSLFDHDDHEEEEEEEEEEEDDDDDDDYCWEISSSYQVIKVIERKRRKEGDFEGQREMGRQE